ncbi:MAG: GNAT family N-acetyltransferase [Candidatus Diapherotrites archaeon]|uniref:GNAT family N-acetyltransferase n=1 Tax=Candidatus Iainarchaeum sp. TaxID=3101447 RepID=A0A8T4C5Z9_9ARCH|nr:GNAT family N-acetyltransferase [Candidatus Diapherotrites archaeon]
MPSRRRPVPRNPTGELPFHERPLKRPPRRIEMKMELPRDKRVHESLLHIGSNNLGKVQYSLEENSTHQKPNIKIQYLIPTHEHKKYGARLLAHFLLQAKINNVHHVVADVGEDNQASQRMFERMGFSLKKVPLGGRERESGAGRYLYRFTLDLEHMGMEGIVKRLRTSLNQPKQTRK